MSKENVEQAETISFELPTWCPFQCGEHFIIRCDEKGLHEWVGIGPFEDEYCGWEASRNVRNVVADAIFQLSIAEGKDEAESLLLVGGLDLPVDYIDRENIDYA